MPTATLFGLPVWASAARASRRRIRQRHDGRLAFGLAAAQGALSADKSDIDALEARYRLPLPRLNLGGCLREIATAAADVSDGLLADLGHITEASGCGAMIELEKIPLSPAVRRLVDEDAGRWGLVVTGGDDYEIVFTGRNESRVTEFSARLGLPITAIGRVIQERNDVRNRIANQFLRGGRSCCGRSADAHGSYLLPLQGSGIARGWVGNNEPDHHYNHSGAYHCRRRRCGLCISLPRLMRRSRIKKKKASLEELEFVDIENLSIPVIREGRVDRYITISVSLRVGPDQELGAKFSAPERCRIQSTYSYFLCNPVSRESILLK